MNDNQKPQIDPNTTSNETTQAEQREAELKRFKENITKKIKVSPLPAPTKEMLQQALTLLQSLKDEIVSKQHGTQEKSDGVQTKFLQLKATGKIKFNDKDVEESQQRTQRFVRLLDNMIQEIDRDVLFYTPFITETSESEISALIFEPDDFEQFIMRRIFSIKKYVKNAQHDLTIGYSRYCFGFDRQLQQLEALERYIKNLK
jgi:hypothetical protein